jgi:hypothetical protein
MARNAADPQPGIGPAESATDNVPGGPSWSLPDLPTGSNPVPSCFPVTRALRQGVWGGHIQLEHSR